MKYLILLCVLAGSAFAVEPGLYHDPDSPGHGVQVNTAPDGYRVLTWFTYGPILDADSEPLDAAQAWFVSENWQPGETVPLFRPSGYFPAQFFELGEPVGNIRIRETDTGLRLDFQVFDWPKGCDGSVQFGPPWCSGTVFLELLAGQ